MNHSNMLRNCAEVFHQYSFVNKINLPTYMSPGNSHAISLIDHTWCNLNGSKGCYFVSPTPFGYYDIWTKVKLMQSISPYNLHKNSLLTESQQIILLKLKTFSVIILFITLETSSNPFHSVALTISIILFLMICQSFFPLVTETESLESPMCMNKKCASTIFLVDSSSCEKNY